MFSLILLSIIQLSGVNAAIKGEEISAKVGADGTCSFALEVRFPDWEEDTYVMLPSGAYDGNRPFKSIESRWYPRELYGTNCAWTLTSRVPSMGPDGKGVIEGGVGDLATPVGCFYFPRQKKGVFVFFEHKAGGRYTGFLVTNGLMRVQYPARKYDILWPNRTPEDDPPIAAEPGSTIRSQFHIHEFSCASIPAFYEEFFRQRKSFKGGKHAPFPSRERHAYLVKMCANHLASTHWHGSPYSQGWVAGWPGGTIDVAGMVAAGFPGSRDMARQSLDFLAETQRPCGFFLGNSYNGKPIPERSDFPETIDYHLIRRSADALFYGFDLMKVTGRTEKWDAAFRKCLDAFIRVYERDGAIPHYVKLETGECIAGGTCNGAILPAALIKAADHFNEPKYIDYAKRICEQMCETYVSRGLCIGGPGGNMCAPDSESPPSLLESCVTLAERTGDRKWVEWAKQVAHILSTWVVSYEFEFPPESQFGIRKVNSVGSVFASVQNRHAAPGFCIDSGTSLLRLAKLTGNPLYRELYEDVWSFQPQVISTPDHPYLGTMVTKEPYQVEYGAMHERVNTSGWEGWNWVGQNYWRGAWSMTSFCLMPYPPEEKSATLVDRKDERIFAVQLDLARQMEAVPFIKNFMRRVATAGYNTVVLYLEDRIRTPTYPYPTKEESYSLDEMREIVHAANELGLDLVPVVSPFGHAERFLKHPELRKFAEERGGFGRWGKCTQPGVFCLELPEAREWMEKYITEVASVFPGKNLHLGFDEVFNIGCCEICRPIMEKEGAGGLYMREVLWAHELAKKLGKRMWMWDDFFAFFPHELERLPKDILLCAWMYDTAVEPTGFRNNFSRRRRRDNLREYERLGIEAIYCPWYSPENIATLTDYAAPRKSAGALCTQWEMGADMHGIFFPRVLAAVELWKGRATGVGDAWLLTGVKKAFPSLDAAGVRAAAATLMDSGKILWSMPSVEKCLNQGPENSKLLYWEDALEVLRRASGSLALDTIAADPLSEEALLDDLITRTEMTILCGKALRSARTLFTPMRMPNEVRAAKAELNASLVRWQELVARRKRQWKAWRGCEESHHFKRFHESYPQFVREVLSLSEIPKENEWILEVDLAMPDSYGAPRWTIEGCFGGEWRELAKGAWKPRTDEAAVVHRLTRLELESVPESLRVSYHGYGVGQLAHVSLWNRTRRLVPSEVLAVSGQVKNPEMLLVDTIDAATFGDFDGEGNISRPTRASAISLVELKLNDLP